MYLEENKEYVNWPDGTLTFKVYDKKQKAVAEGTKVKIKGLANEGESQEFTVGEDGLVTIPKQYLPDADVTTSAYVKTDDMADYEETPTNTLVSARIDTKIVLQEGTDLTGGVTSPLMLSLMENPYTSEVYCSILKQQAFTPETALQYSHHTKASLKYWMR